MQNKAAMKPSLVVMAAGIGSRYGGLKQVDPVGPSGEIVVDYSVFDALEAGFGKIIFIIRRDIEATFKSVMEPHFRGRFQIEYVFQELSDLPPGFQVPADRKKPWGTGHAILRCRDVIHEPFGVINADDFYGKSSYRVLAERLRQYSPGDSRSCLVAFVLRNTLSDHGAVARGVCQLDENGHLVGVKERGKVEKAGSQVRYMENDQWFTLTGNESVSMNMWGFTPTLFDQLDKEFKNFLPTGMQNPKAEFLIPSVVDTLIRRGEAKVEVLNSNERWLGVTYPEDKPIVMAGVRQLIKAGVYPENLWGNK